MAARHGKYNGKKVRNAGTGNLGGSSRRNVRGASGVRAPDGQPVTAPDVEADEQLSDEDRASMAAFMQSMRAQAAWSPACVICLNAHKLAIAELGDKLTAAGWKPGTEEWNTAFSVAVQFGQILSQQPGVELPPGQFVIPPVRTASTLMGGTAICAVCFIPQKQTSLLQASPNVSAAGLIKAAAR